MIKNIFTYLIQNSLMILEHSVCHYYAYYHVLIDFLYLSYHIVYKLNLF